MATQASTLGRKVAAWQLAHMDNFDYTHGHRATPDPRGWVQGALFVGLAAFAERTGDPALARPCATTASRKAGAWAASAARRRPCDRPGLAVGAYGRDHDPPRSRR
jgi:unsaturated rhamnogalacturonyl hydrolase